MRWVSRLVTVALLVGLVAVVALLIRARVGQQAAGQAFVTWGQFRDASRLPVGSRVMIAGVHVGEISSLAVDGRLARVTMHLQDDVELWDDAWAEKKVASAFGDGYVEIHPGGAGPGRRRLVSGEPLGHVFEGVSIDRTLRELDQALPRGQAALRGAHDVLASARQVVGGRMALQLARLDAALKDGSIAEPLHRANDAMTAFEEATTAAADSTDGLAATVDRRLTSFEQDTASAAATLREGQTWVRDGMTTARARIDAVDPYLTGAADTLAEYAGKVPPEDQGTLATLINDPALGDAIADTAEAGRDFLKGLTRLNTNMGLRTELNLRSGETRFYVAAEITGHNDSFYLVEAMKTNAGTIPEVTIADSPGSPGFARKATILEGIRLTLQWGKRTDWAAVRFGLKESTFGFGADGFWLGGRARASIDLYGPSFSDLPRVKLAAALQVFRNIYLWAGVDDILRSPGAVPIAPWPAEQDVPTQFRELRYGRDAFLGLQLRFDDEDLNTLLAIYGAAVISAL